MPLGELLLRSWTRHPPTKEARTRLHPALGHVLSTEVDGVDDYGFRNPDGMGDASLVAIGDSHTYGYNVAREASWPALVAARRGLSLYVLANGG